MKSQISEKLHDIVEDLMCRDDAESKEVKQLISDLLESRNLIEILDGGE